jgi:hypothetical protein
MVQRTQGSSGFFECETGGGGAEGSPSYTAHVIVAVFGLAGLVIATALAILAA